MRIKTFSFSLTVILATITFLLVGCKKDNFTNENDISSAKTDKIFKEIAFPNEKGIISEINFNGQKIQAEYKNGYYIIEGDLAFTKRDLENYNAGNNMLSSRTYKNVQANLWPSGKVYYTIDNSFSSQEMNEITSAIQTATNSTNSLQFIPRTSQTNYISIIKGAVNSGLFSDFIGMKGGAQIINLETNSFNEGSVLHEIGHAIGLYHEQSRSDRDLSVNILWANILNGRSHNFMTYNQLNQPGNQLGTFDFSSIMLYGPFFFSSNGQPTITRLDGSIYTSNRDFYSAGDIETIQFLYGAAPFAKLTRTLVYEEYEPDDRIETYTYNVEFFADVFCTIPTNLTSDREVTVDFFETYYQGLNYQTSNHSYTTTFVAGTNNYILAENVNTYERHYDYGNIIYGYDRNYVIRANFVRP